jgi:hypothetical protein
MRQIRKPWAYRKHFRKPPRLSEEDCEDIAIGYPDDENANAISTKGSTGANLR